MMMKTKKFGFLQGKNALYHLAFERTTFTIRRTPFSQRTFASGIRRPISPHLGIYRPQITWILSASHRITGSALATLIYGFGIGYALSSSSYFSIGKHEYLGEIQRLLSVGGSGTRVLTRIALVVPLVFHSLNGLRHIIWDFGWGMSVKSVRISGWATLAATCAFSGWICSRKASSSSSTSDDEFK